MLLNHFRKLKWIIKNYGDISFSRKLVPADHTGVPTTFPGPITYATDGLATSNNADFIKSPRFAKAYAAAAATNPWPGFTLQWRVYIVCWLADFVKKLDGDFVECGVNTGAYSSAVISYTDFSTLGKKFYLLDTFEGMPEQMVNEQEKKAGIDQYLGTHYQNVYEQVKKTFSTYPVEIIQGMVPDTLPKCSAEKICYLSIDMNAVAPEIAAAEYFWNKLVPGAVMILDDYGFPMHIHQKLAFDAFAKEKGVEILCLPTGQGIIFKP